MNPNMNMNPGMGMNMNMGMNPNMGMPPSMGMNLNMSANPNMGMRPNPQMNYMPPQNQYGMQQQPPQAMAFIAGKIGTKIIASEDLATFQSNLKETEWTQNPIYKKAQNADVQTTFVSNQNNRGLNYQRVNFDSYLLDVVPALSEFDNYANDCLQRNASMVEEGERKRIEFMKTCFPQENTDMNMIDLFGKIKTNRSFVLSKDPVLYKKVDQLLPFLVNDNVNKQVPVQQQPPVVQQPQNNMNYGYQQQTNPQSVMNSYSYGQQQYGQPQKSNIYGNAPQSIYGNMSNRGYY